MKSFKTQQMIERNPNKKGLEHLRKMNYDKTQFEIIPKDVDKIDKNLLNTFKKLLQKQNI